MRRHVLRVVAGISVLAVLPAACGSTAVPDRPTASATSTSAAAAGCTIPDRFRGQDVERLPVAQPVVALTFDAGANADGVRRIVKTLRAHEAPATFFLTGRFVDTFPMKARRIGTHYLVGNHTDTHRDLTTLPDDAVVREIRTAHRAILAATGQNPRRFFRFPFGARTSHDIALANSLCYVPFRWTVDTLGWQGTSGGMSVSKVVARVMAAAVPGAIVLMHVGGNPDDGTTLDADALGTVIGRLEARGYALVPLSRVLAARP